MRDHDETLPSKRHLSELFSALKAVVASSPNLQSLIRAQEQDNRQVLLNMSSVLRMVERDQAAEAEGVEVEQYVPKVVAGWMRGDGTLVHGRSEDVNDDLDTDPDAPDGPMNYFDRAFLKSLKISS